MMMDNPLKFVPPGGYRACANCAAAKAKCIQPDEGDGKCERCLRLGRDCQVMPRAKKRRRQTDGTAASVRPDEDANSAPGAGPRRMSHSAATMALNGESSASPARAPPSPTFGFRISDDEAEGLLRLFREQMDQYNPFVEIPPTMTAATLRAQKPMVFLAIMFAASYHDLEHQKAMARSIMTYISEQMFQQGRKSLQLLQGVIIFLHWYTSQLFANPQVTNLLHIIMALTTDLGLDKQDNKQIPYKSPLAHESNRALHGLQWTPPDHSLDERRALAASFYLTSSISSNVGMLTALGYSTQIDETCKQFEKMDPHCSDYRLAKLVRLQYIISRIYQYQKELEIGTSIGWPLSSWIGLFSQDLERFWATLPDNMRADDTLRLLYHTAEIHVYKMSLTETPQPPLPTTTHPPAPAAEQPEEMHVNCLLALKSWFDTFFAKIPPSRYFHIPIPIFVQLAHADVTFARITAFWGGSRPSSSPSDFPAFPDVMEKLAVSFEEAKRAGHPLGREVNNDIFDTWATRIRGFKALDFSMAKPPKLPGAKAREAPAEGDVQMPTPEGTVVSGAEGPAPGSQEAEDTDWATWFDGLQTSWIVGQPEPVTWQSQYDVWNAYQQRGPSG